MYINFHAMGMSNKVLDIGLQRVSQFLRVAVLLCVLHVVISAAQEPARQEVTVCRLFDSSNSSLSCRCGGVPYLVDCAATDPQSVTVPRSIPQEVSLLNLSNNAIQIIDEHAFTGLELLSLINLSFNDIYAIDEMAFKNLYKLEILLLEGNKIRSLDPSGFRFQHLVSLKVLNLKDNIITKVNKYSFLTVGIVNNVVTLDFTGNAVHCDCNVWALREWKYSVTQRDIHISHLNCANDPEHRNFLDVEDSVFGNCSATQDDVFSQNATCSSCMNENTTFACNLHSSVQCSDDKNLCFKRVTWHNLTGNFRGYMEITSLCTNYDTCLLEEKSNNDTCGLGFQSSGKVICNFCCRGPTCKNETVGGRTKDFTFFLSYIIKNLSNPESLPTDYVVNVEKSRINTVILSIIKNIKGGIDVFIDKFIPLEFQQFHVVVRLVVTTLGTETYESVQQTITNDVNASTVDMVNFLRQQDIDQIFVSSSIKELDHGMECNAMAGICSVNLTCMMSRDGKNRCLCPEATFHSPSSNSCRLLLELRAEKLSQLSSTNNSVTLDWTANKHGTNVSYTITLQPQRGPGVMHTVIDSRQPLTGLRPGTQYTVDIKSTLLANDFYAEKYISSTLFGVWTKSVHGMKCSPNATENFNACTGVNIICGLADSGGNYCLCTPGYYYSFDQTCKDEIELTVKNIMASSSSNDTVTLTWDADSRETKVIYSILPIPNEGTVVPGSVSYSGGKWMGLRPRTQYSFTVYSTLLRDYFYSERTLASTLCCVWTKWAQNFTLYVSYTRRIAEYQSFMSNPSSPQYKAEEQRIVARVRPIVATAAEVIYLRVLRFVPESNDHNHYLVQLQMEVTAFATSSSDSVESDITDAVMANIRDTDDFFFTEDIESLNITSHLSGSNNCPYSITVSKDKGVIKWDVTTSEMQSKLCPYKRPLDPTAVFANRSCQRWTNGFVWGPVTDPECPVRSVSENASLDIVFNITVTPGNARNVSTFLKLNTDNSENFTAETVAKIVNVVEQLTQETFLGLPDVAADLVACVNNLINVDMKALILAQLRNATSRRLLAVIETILDNAPLNDGKLKIVSPNLGLAVQEADSSETRDLMLTADQESGGDLNDSLISVDYSAEHSPEVTNKSSLVIPMKAVFDSLSQDKKDKIKRVSFTVHRSDILFQSITSSTDKGMDLHNDGSSPQNSQTFVTKINSFVIAASVRGVVVENLSTNVTMVFEHENNNATKAQCVFWNESSLDGDGHWSDVGCGVVQLQNGTTTCGCNHLTNFALLMDVYQGGGSLSELDHQILSVISYVGCAISLFALLVTLLTYGIVKKLRRDNPSKILINLCLALLLSNLVFLVGMQEYSFDNTASCKAVAVLLHYFLLASLTWMAVEAFYMYLALILVFKTYFTNFMLKCCLVGWGVPLAIVIITLAVNATDNYGFINSGICWLKNPAFFGAFVAPVCLILLVNFLAFGLVVRQLVRATSSKLHKIERNSVTQRLKGAVAVVVLLGLTWIFAIFAIDQASVVFYYLFTVCNSLQGLFIFIFYCVLKSDTVAAWKRFLPCFTEYGESSQSYSNSKAVHQLTQHSGQPKSKQSKYSGNSRSTSSTLIDSRKDSCFSTLSSNHAMDNTEEYDTSILIAAAAIDKSKLSLQQQNRRAVIKDYPIKTAECGPQNQSAVNTDKTISQMSQKSNHLEYQTENSGDSLYGGRMPDCPSSPKLFNIRQIDFANSEYLGTFKGSISGNDRKPVSSSDFNHAERMINLSFDSDGTVNLSVTPDKIIRPSNTPNEIKSPSCIRDDIIAPSLISDDVTDSAFIHDRRMNSSIIEDEKIHTSIPSANMNSPSATQDETVEPSFIPDEILNPSFTPDEILDPSFTPDEILDPSFPPDEIIDPSFIPDEILDPSFTPDEIIEPSLIKNRSDNLSFTSIIHPSFNPEEIVDPSITPYEVFNPSFVRDKIANPSFTQDAKIDHSFTPTTAEGEIDNSHLGRVIDIRHNFERSFSETSDRSITET